MQRNGKITEKELSPQLLKKIGMGNLFQRETISIPATEENQKVVEIPIKNYNQQYHKFEVRVGGVPFSDYRFTIKGNAIHLNEDEEGIELGREIDFVCYWNTMMLSKENMPQFIRSDDIIDHSIETKKLVPYAQEFIDDLVDMDVAPADVEIYGRTLLNLMGRTGNGIYKQGWTCASGADTTLEYIEDNIVFTNNNNTPEDNNRWAFADKHPCENGKYFIKMSEALLTDAEEGAAIVMHGSPTHHAPLMKIHDKWMLVYSTGVTSDLEPSVQVTINVVGKGKGHFRNIRCYEISKEIYDKIDVDPEYTGDNLAKKFPYVDDIKCVVNPYVECSENLLPTNIMTPRYTYNIHDGGQMPGLDTARATILGRTYIKPSTDYTLTSDKVLNIPNLECRASIFNGDSPMLWDSAWGTPFSKTFTFTSIDDRNLFALFSFRKTDDMLFTKEEYEQISGARFSLVEGNLGKNYEECYESRILFETELYDGEKITKNSNGKYVKNSIWEDINILGEGTIAWESDTLKTIEIKMESMNIIDVDDAFGITYNGNFTNHVKFGHPAPENVTTLAVGNGVIHLVIPNKITGWGEYIPTKEEINAFLLGWRLGTVDDRDKLYNGTGSKAWYRLWCGMGDKTGELGGLAPVISGFGTPLCPTHMNNTGYIPYKIICKKKTPVIKEVRSHGHLVIKQGVPVSVKSGLVLAEPSDINTDGETCTGGFIAPKYPVDVVNAVRYKDSYVPFTLGSRQVSGSSHRYMRGTRYPIFTHRLKNDDIVYIDYTIEDRSNVSSFDYSIVLPQNIQKIVHRTINELSETNARLSEENKMLQNKIDHLPLATNDNLVLNGDFRVWQRGTSFTTENKIQYTADRWKSERNTGRISKEDITVKDFVATSCVCIETLANSPDVYTGIAQLFDKDEFGKLYNGQVITVSFWYYTNAEGSIQFWNGTSNRTGRLNILGQWTYRTYTLQFYDDAKYGFSLSFRPNQLAGSMLKIANVKLELGDKATPFVPRPYLEELDICQRYYEVIDGKVQGSMYTAPHVIGNGLMDFSINYKTKRTRPTISLPSLSIGSNNTGTVTDFVPSVVLNGTERGVLRMTKANHGLTSQQTPYLRHDVPIIIDAEIY